MKISKKMSFFNLLLLICFIIWSLMVSNQTSFIKTFDQTVIRQVYHHNAFSLSIFRFLTSCGNTNTITILTIISVIILSLMKYFYAAGFVAINEITVSWINHTIKMYVQRPRPEHHHYVYAGGYSFPSGHSAGSFALYISLLIIALFVFKKLSVKITLSLIAIGLVILIGYSRIFLGVHYPSDVVGGYLLAATILIFTTLLFRAKNLSILKLKGI
ncbi:phosphatase PAP2 family protein [Companilactobacillus jidongensis]|uniref:phosphatase PAP2 family protein n=1 Tax=Companilactobacillus jidongensis TaxID=2486006 RepID=UPI000F7A16AD|nr:phosphatase PAP2 family protein [Companilactobacillus jidongensis]